MRSCCAALCLLLAIGVTTAPAAELDKHIQALQAVGPKGSGHQAAVAAAKALSQADAKQLPEILAGMDQANALAANWFRAIAETVADRAVREDGKLPVDKLEAFLRDTSHAPRSRRLAFELISRVDKSAKQRLIPRLNQDPSLELRRDAIGMMIDRAENHEEAGRKDVALQTLQSALVDARDIDQIQAIAKSIEGLGGKVDRQTLLGFVAQWNLVGPFDNEGGVGFEKAYPPERDVQLNAEYAGVDGKVRWKTHATDDPYGTVDLNAALDKHKGAVAYAYTVFNAAESRPCDIRIGCINANKVWLNGELIISNRVYHSGMDIDQYVGKGRLRAGKNTILVKVCQNEQTEPWAQRWQFQLRVCDALGGAILAADRKLPESAAVETGQPANVAAR